LENTIDSDIDKIVFEDIMDYKVVNIFLYSNSLKEILKNRLKKRIHKEDSFFVESYIDFNNKNKDFIEMCINLCIEKKDFYNYYKICIELLKKRDKEYFGYIKKYISEILDKREFNDIINICSNLSKIKDEEMIRYIKDMAEIVFQYEGFYEA